MMQRFIENKSESSSGDITPTEAAVLKSFDDFFSTLPHSADGLTEAELEAFSIRANNVYKQLSLMANAPQDDYFARRLYERVDDALGWVKVFKQWTSLAQAMREADEKIAARKALDPDYDNRLREHLENMRQSEASDALRDAAHEQKRALAAIQNKQAQQAKELESARFADLVVEESLKITSENPNNYLSLEDHANLAQKRARARFENKSFLKRLIGA